MSSRSSERDRSMERDRKRTEDFRSDSYRKRRSRSPRENGSHARRRDSLDDYGRRARHRSYRDDRKHSRRDRSPLSPKRDPSADGEDPRRSPHHPSHRLDRTYSRGRHRSVSLQSKRAIDANNRRRSSHHRTHRNLTSPPPPRSRSPPPKRSHAPLPSQKAAFNTSDSLAKPLPDAQTEKQKPNYAPTGALAAETNTVANTSIILKYNEPPESRLPPPTSPYRLYVFKGSEVLETIPLHQRTCWLFGRERAVVDHAMEHPSCSKQHAVLQFRFTEKKDEWGERKGGVKLYVIDLESANGTKVNGERVPERRYVEVRSGDVVTFGESTREYVVLLPPKEEKKS